MPRNNSRQFIFYSKHVCVSFEFGRSLTFGYVEVFSLIWLDTLLRPSESRVVSHVNKANREAAASTFLLSKQSRGTLTWRHSANLLN